MKGLTVLLSVLVVSPEQTKCDEGMLMPEDWSGSGYSDVLTPIETLSTVQTPVPTPTRSSLSVAPQTTTTISPPPPSDQPTTLSFLTSTIFIVPVGCGAVVLALIFIACLVVCRKSRRMKKCRYWCCCPCSRRYKARGPHITVTFRNSYYHGERESYYIRTDDTGPTTLYTRPGEDDANMEFTAAMFYTPSTKDQVNKLQNAVFNRLEGEGPAPRQQTEISRGAPRAEIDDGFHIQELEVLERVLDNALVKFETTTL